MENKMSIEQIFSEYYFDRENLGFVESVRNNSMSVNQHESDNGLIYIELRSPKKYGDKPSFVWSYQQHQNSRENTR